MCLGLFLSTVETSITATALVSIGHYFNNSIMTTWVVLGYLLSYMGFSVIVARLSDVISRKSAAILCWVLFAGFSLASGLAQSLRQLIAFRTIQGIGGSGLFSLPLIILPELAPKRLWGLMSSFMGVSLACSYIVGPVLGGLIVQRTSWRWIYLFNAPIAVMAVAVLAVAWPTHSKEQTRKRDPIFAQIDIPGALLLLVASVLLVFALQEAGALRFNWNSSIIITALSISGISWVAFIAWISWLSFKTKLHAKPIFPILAVLRRPTGPALLITFLTGFPFFVVIINLPLRFQIVNGDNPIMAGVHLIPMLGISAFGSTIGGILSSRKNLTSYSVIIGSCFVLLGSGLLSTVSHSASISPSQYVYQLIFGFGTGISFSSSVLMTTLSNTPDKIGEKNFNVQHSCNGALGQARVLGGTIGLAIATIIFNHNIAADLSGTLSPKQLLQLQQSITTIFDLDPSQQVKVAVVFANSFNIQMRNCMYLSAAALVVALFTWQRNPASIADSRSQLDIAGETR
ncbi:hypothetical protein OIDMADRAFT_103461 [Oidiodendron maius Zn]|uniref:Major facilitator superfamily (MFS) profile domain-containing protein n=1 Tax=Oidiodendron maius (strain Zn) TaxID=913774 RepID=A0A0C3CTG0_OIDMZ|nr:hypothetical protein OIDMADRAFT_103461 [Oidiodendron maius Zn]